MTADEILDVLDKLHALRHVRAITPEEFAVRKAHLLGLLDGAIGLDAVGATATTGSPETAGSDDTASPAEPAPAGRRRAPGISPNVAVAMLLVVTAIVGVIAFTLGRSVPEPGTGAQRTAVVVSTTPTTATTATADAPTDTDR